jgi:hypothetical protein
MTKVGKNGVSATVPSTNEVANEVRNIEEKFNTPQDTSITSNPQILMITGPGGIGKSPLGRLIKEGVIHLEPYRLRKNGPRDQKDCWYANLMLYDQLEYIVKANNNEGICHSHSNYKVTWYPKIRFAKYKVRDEWQILLIPEIVSDQLIKMEVYAPALVALLEIPDFRELLEASGRLKIIILNPSNKSLTEENGVVEDIAELTYENCKLRDEKDKATAEKRRDSVADEVPPWKDLILRHNAVELTGWPYAEYIWEESDFDKQKVINYILEKDKTLAKFFK